jgi:hypothetical protein
MENLHRVEAILDLKYNRQIADTYIQPVMYEYKLNTCKRKDQREIEFGDAHAIRGSLGLG